MMMERSAFMAGNAAIACRIENQAGGAEDDPTGARCGVKKGVHQMESQVGYHQQDQQRRQQALESVSSARVLSKHPMHMRYSLPAAAGIRCTRLPPVCHSRSDACRSETVARSRQQR